MDKNNRYALDCRTSFQRSRPDGDCFSVGNCEEVLSEEFDTKEIVNTWKLIDFFF